jgi:hypothetical protein
LSARIGIGAVQLAVDGVAPADFAGGINLRAMRPGLPLDSPVGPVPCWQMRRRKPQKPAPVSVPPDGAIISPAIDFLCCGGFSIFAVLAIFAYAYLFPTNKLISEGINIIVIGILGTLINAPHFMASYHLVYRKREQISQHKWASLYVPLILVALIIYAFLTPDPKLSELPVNIVVAELLIFLSFVLLAWHYTGQAWGMTGAFAYLRGIRMDVLERRLVRSGYYALLGWHILWACLFTLKTGSVIGANFTNQIPKIEFIYQVWSVLVLLTIPLGIVGFLRIRRRTGIKPPLRCYAPWVAIYLWYALIWKYPSMFPVLQIFHAMQYLIFPLRVEMNQYSARQKRTGGRQFLHAVGYYLILVVVGFIVFEIPPVPVHFVALVAAFVNIHHYFIDGAIWKIRNPQVRNDLFAHLKLPVATKSPV